LIAIYPATLKRREGKRMVYRILAHWDAEAGVWWAESIDVKGLVAEADTLEELVADLREVVPELLSLNHGIDPLREATEITVLADRTESLQIAV
jgi:predicted RNase H-like HicB family nuclease